MLDFMQYIWFAKQAVLNKHTGFMHISKRIWWHEVWWSERFNPVSFVFLYQWPAVLFDQYQYQYTQLFYLRWNVWHVSIGFVHINTTTVVPYWKLSQRYPINTFLLRTFVIWRCEGHFLWFEFKRVFFKSIFSVSQMLIPYLVRDDVVPQHHCCAWRKDLTSPCKARALKSCITVTNIQHDALWWSHTSLQP